MARHRGFVHKADLLSSGNLPRLVVEVDPSEELRNVVVFTASRPSRHRGRSKKAVAVPSLRGLSYVVLIRLFTYCEQLCAALGTSWLDRSVSLGVLALL
jgi:hypothetical protein